METLIISVISALMPLIARAIGKWIQVQENAEEMQKTWLAFVKAAQLDNSSADLQTEHERQKKALEELDK